MAYDIASDLSYEVLQERRRLRELSTPRLDSVNCSLYGIGDYRDFIADVDEFGDRARPELDRGRSDLPERATSAFDPLLGHYRPAKR
jgi:hypothetical protein